MQRIRELTVQASTGTNSDSDLSSIQDEIKSRLDEIDRVSGQTQFNGVERAVENDSMKIQIGANDNQTISIGLQTNRQYHFESERIYRVRHGGFQRGETDGC